MTVVPGFDPSLAPSITQYEIYTQNGPMPLGGGLFITEDGKIEVNAAEIPGIIFCGTF
jgi:hypothetical protein